MRMEVDVTLAPSIQSKEKERVDMRVKVEVYRVMELTRTTRVGRVKTTWR